MADQGSPAILSSTASPSRPDLGLLRPWPDLVHPSFSRCRTNAGQGRSKAEQSPEQAWSKPAEDSAALRINWRLADKGCSVDLRCSPVSTQVIQSKYSANPRRESGDYVELRHAHSKTLARSPERENGPDRHGVRRWSQRNRRFPFRVRRIYTGRNSTIPS